MDRRTDGKTQIDRREQDQYFETKAKFNIKSKNKYLQYPQLIFEWTNFKDFIGHRFLYSTGFLVINFKTFEGVKIFQFIFGTPFFNLLNIKIIPVLIVKEFKVEEQKFCVFFCFYILISFMTQQKKN